MPYLELDLTGDFNALSNIGQNYLRTQIPGWEPRPGNIESILIESVAQMLAEVIDQVSLVPPAVFAEMGEVVFGIPMNPAIAAVSTATFTIRDGAPAMTIPQQTQLTVESVSGDPSVFVTTAELPVVAGQTFDATVQAQVPGAAANGALGDSDLNTANLVTAIDGVTRVQVAEAVGGVDEEDQDAYIDRLAELLRIMAPRAITANDFVILGQQVPGVGRVLALDGYVPAAGDFTTGAPMPDYPNAIGDSTAPEVQPTPQQNVPRALTLAITTESGERPNKALMQSVYDAMVAAREVNVLSYVIAPTYTQIDVRGSAVGFPGIDPGAVGAAAQDSVTQWLDPTQFGQDPQSREPTWALNTAVRLYEAVDWMNRGAGVHWVHDVQIRVHNGTWGTADIPLTGAAPLPLLGDISGIVGEAP